jgi:hypothetical protein
VLVTKAFLAKNPNTVLVALAALLESQNLIWTDTNGTIQNFATWAQTTPDKADPLVKEFQAVGNRSLMWKDEALKNAQKTIAVVNPDIIDVDVAKAADHSLIQKLLDIGFYSKIGNPATTP